LADAHNHHTASELRDGRVLVVGGGGNAPGNPHAAEVLDPATGRFIQVAALSTAPRREGHTATTLVDGRVLVTGGVDNDACVTDAEIYDPATNRWAATAPLLAARQDHTATLLANGSVLVTGGSTAACPAPNAEIYDSATGRWSPAGKLSANRAEHDATLLLDGRVLLTGGYDFSRGVSSPEPVTVATAPA